MNHLSLILVFLMSTVFAFGQDKAKAKEVAKKRDFERVHVFGGVAYENTVEGKTSYRAQHEHGSSDGTYLALR